FTAWTFLTTGCLAFVAFADGLFAAIYFASAAPNDSCGNSLDSHLEQVPDNRSPKRGAIIQTAPRPYRAIGGRHPGSCTGLNFGPLSPSQRVHRRECFTYTTARFHTPLS